MKNQYKILFVILGFFLFSPTFVHADDKLDSQIQALEIQLKNLADKTGKYAKMSAEKLEKEAVKLQKKLDVLIDEWEKENGRKYRKNISDATKKAGKEIKKAGKKMKKAAKKAVKKLDKALDD